MALALQSQAALAAQPRGPAQQQRRALTKDEQDEVRFAFDTLDCERSGQVTPKHLKVCAPGSCCLRRPSHSQLVLCVLAGSPVRGGLHTIACVTNWVPEGRAACNGLPRQEAGRHRAVEKTRRRRQPAARLQASGLGVDQVCARVVRLMAQLARPQAVAYDGATTHLIAACSLGLCATS